MQINEAMNLVVPIVSDESGVRVWGYHTPISRQVFEANYRVLAATKAALASQGSYYLMDAGPRVAALTLRDEGARQAEARGGKDEATPALLAEIHRLTMVLVPTAAGWDLQPVETAIASGKMDAEDWSEAESGIVFFTCICALASKADRKNHASGTASLLKGSITSLSPTEFADSLPKSIPDEISVRKAASSVPS